MFTGGRTTRLLSNEEYAKEFFYGFFELKQFYKNTIISDIQHEKSFFLKYLDKLILKILAFPISLNCFINKKFKQDLKGADIVILVNESVMFFSLLYLYYSKKIHKDLKIYLFTMGLFSKQRRGKRFKKLREKVLIFILNNIDGFFCLGEGEYKHIVQEYKNYEAKFKFINFGIDSDFWSDSDSYDKNERDFILFVGNDLNRDFQFLVDLINSMPNQKFKVLSSRLSCNDFTTKNVEVINGIWWKNTISDEEIKNLYKYANLTILPLKDTFQPSGQSVALQSMSMGTPVLITKTRGFWDEEIKNNKHIFFANQNTLALWKELIQNILSNFSLLVDVSSNSKQIIKNKYSIKKFNEELMKYLD